jgi:phospholipase/carboxylesterase
VSKLETKIVLNKSAEKPVGAVIWLHGLGADYNDFVPIVNELHLPFGLKFVFPNAPVIPVTINNGFQMRAWYDILDMGDLHREVDSNGIVKSVEQINLLLEDLIHEGFKPEQIVIAGFSQGGVISYYTALNSSYHLAGMMVLSSYLPDISLLDVAHVKTKASLPTLICHGNQDPVVSIAFAKKATEHLTQLGLNYQWHEYPMQHGVCYEEIEVISQWLQKIFAK